jgi:hypothetical protein
MKTLEAPSIHEEHIALSLGIKGEFQDILLDSNGVIVWERPWQHNLIVSGMSRLLAALIKGDKQGKPLNFWAVGVGGSGMAGSTLSEKRELTTLINEIARKPIEYITFLDEYNKTTTALSNRLEIKVYFTIEQIAGKEETRMLREFGLFAGGNTTLNSGIMINHRTHAAIELTKGFTLQRALRLTF